jgi:DNA repair exonuclease SbcCD ATPase subunit
MQHSTQRSRWPIGAVCTLLIASQTSFGQDNRPTEIKSELAAAQAAIETLRAEVSQLRKEVAHLQLEQHRDSLRRTKAELESVRAERNQLEELERAREQDLRELDGLLEGRDVAAAERSEVEVSRSELLGARATEIQRLSEVAKGREDELLRRQKTEEQFIQRLEETLKVTGGERQ